MRTILIVTNLSIALACFLAGGAGLEVLGYLAGGIAGAMMLSR